MGLEGPDSARCMNRRTVAQLKYFLGWEPPRIRRVLGVFSSEHPSGRQAKRPARPQSAALVEQAPDAPTDLVERVGF